MRHTYLALYRLKPKKKKKRYFDINPTRFQKGDIVELAVSFLCVPIKGGKYKMITSLKTILLLDNTTREVCS